MKDNQNVNCQVTADTAEAEEVTAAAELGKFKDVKALKDAYDALEAEFTRRSQRLKELEANKEENAAATAKTAEAPSQRAKISGEEGTPAQSAPLSDEVKNAVIEEYLNSVCLKRGVPFVTGGGAVAAQRHTPVTVREAGVLAGKLFNNKEDK